MHTVPYALPQFPSYRIQEAIARGARDKWCFYVWGGLGDRICSEPTIRWAHENLRYSDFAIATNDPELFDHIDCKKFKIGPKDHGGTCPPGNSWRFDDWYTCWTIYPPGTLQWEFFSHCMTQAVDYVSLSCLRMQLPVAAREIKLPDFGSHLPMWALESSVVIHPGKHWPSKTFPSDWWSRVCLEIIGRGITPILVGKRVDENVGYVDFIPPDGTVDLREKQSLSELVDLLKRTRCLISNDSSPIHIAASGDAFIGVVATCKHPDYIGHWRHGEWQWRFQNLSRTGLYDRYQVSPFTDQDITVEDIDPVFLAECLPSASSVADFAEQSVASYYK